MIAANLNRPNSNDPAPATVIELIIRWTAVGVAVLAVADLVLSVLAVFKLDLLSNAKLFASVFAVAAGSLTSLGCRFRTTGYYRDIATIVGMCGGFLIGYISGTIISATLSFVQAVPMH